MALGAGPWVYRHWDKEYLVTYSPNGSSSQAAAAAYDSDGTLVHEAVVWFPESREVYVHDAGVTQAGKLIVAAAIVKNDGALANVIAEFDESGKPSRVIQTSPFVVWNVCSVGDDVWAYGYDRDKSRKGQLSYMMLQQYSFATGIKQSNLDRRSFPGSFLMRGRVSGDVDMRCNTSSLVLYVGPTSEVIRLDLASNKLDRWRFPTMPEESRVNGFALAKTGHIFISMMDYSHAGQALTGLFRFEERGPGNGVWTALPESVTPIQGGPPKFLVLFGSQGDQLVYKLPQHSATMSWSNFTF